MSDSMVGPGLWGAELQVEKFVSHFLPSLARHYRGEALNELESSSGWLRVFSLRQANFDDAVEHFFRDGSSCAHTLKNHIDLTRLARTNEAPTRRYGSVYSLFLAKLYAGSFSLTLGHKDSPVTQQAYGTDAEIEEMSRRVDDISQIEDLALNDFSLSFLNAGLATL